MQTQLDDYWQRVEPIAKLPLPPQDHEHDVYFLWHQSREKYGRGHQEIGITLTEAGERVYVHAKAYYSTPNIIVTVAFTTPIRTAIGEEVGQVLDSEARGAKHHEVASCQAWYYEKERTLMLWEVDVRSHYAGGDPSQDFLLITLWDAFEQALLQEVPECYQIITPGWEPGYEVEQWKSFLSARGYNPHRENTYIKTMGRK